MALVNLFIQNKTVYLCTNLGNRLIQLKIGFAKMRKFKFTLVRQCSILYSNDEVRMKRLTSFQVLFSIQICTPMGDIYPVAADVMHATSNVVYVGKDST